MIFIALILSLIAALALLRMLRSAGFSQLRSARRALHCKLRLLRSARAASFALIAKQSLHCAKRFALLTLVSLALVHLSTSCAQMHDEPALSENDDTKVYITIQIAPEGPHASRGTAPNPGNDVYPGDDIYTDGTDFENTIKTVTVFIADVPDNTSANSENPTISHATGEPYFTVFTLRAPNGGYNFLDNSGTYTTGSVEISGKVSGKKAVYVAANLSIQQIQHIAQYGVDAAYQFPTNSITMVNDITSAANGCAMFCTKPVIFDPNDGVDHVNVAPLQFELRRIMAKVLVTVKYENHQPKVTALYGGKPTFEVNEVKFIVNTINTRTYLFQQYAQKVEASNSPQDWSNIIKDPNWDRFLAVSEYQHFYTPMNDWEYYKNFFQSALEYEQPKMPDGSNDATCYSAGLYVPENSFDSSLAPNLTGLNTEEKIAAAEAEFTDLAEHNVSHVIVRAFITPLILKVNKGLGDYMIANGTSQEIKYIGTLINQQAASAGATNDTDIFVYTCEGFAGDANTGRQPMSAKEESDYITMYSLMYEGYEGKLNYKSFFTKDETVDVNGTPTTITFFYCYSAAKIVAQGDSYKKGEGNDIKTFNGIQVYDLGYAHYKVYLNDNLGNDHVPNSGTRLASATKWRESQIYRNTYYILVVDAFAGVAGGIDPTKKTIEVHTETIKMYSSWSAEVGLNDSDGDAEIVNPVQPTDP